MNSRIKLLLMAVVLFSCTADGYAAPLIQLDLNGQRVEGKPIFWSPRIVAILGRDGRLWEFTPGAARNPQKGSADFRSYSQAQMRGALLEEFGSNFDVSGTGQYLVVHPNSQRDLWAPRFEELYRSMVHYFRARGFQMGKPEFPFVAVVFPRQHDFLSYTRQHDMRDVGSNVLGFYDNASNRIFLYDVTAGKQNSSSWFVNAETIIHEAAHQTAFNTGLHSRFNPNPVWVVEGIGTMFEARGVFDTFHYTELGDRVHRGQLETFKQVVQSNSRELLASLVSSDRLFQANPTAAYAASWALSFYLSEREPRKYAGYLKTIASRPPYRDYSSKDRIRDFMSAFGTDSKMLDARLHRFLDELK